jgi:hypothetical protein
VRYTVRHTALFLTASLLGLTPTLGSAQTGGADDVACQDLQVPLSGLPEDAVLELKFSPSDLLKQCSSASGAALQVVSPANGIALTPDPGSRHTIPFTVRDDEGHQATAKVIVIRD